MMQAIALDDEPIALNIIKTFVGSVPNINLIGCFTNAVAALEFMQQHEVHLIFLDIKMPGLSGIKFLQNLDTKPIVIMTTAYSEYAVQGFELEVLDYLLKPFKPDRFLKACAKAVRQYEQTSQANVTAQAEEIFIKSGYERIKVQVNDILYIESVGNYMHFKLTDKTVIGRYTLQELQ